MKTISGNIKENEYKEPSFNPKATLSDGTRFIIDPLDEKYVELPGEFAPREMLPREEHQVRAALVELKIYSDKFASFGVISWIFQNAKYKAAKEIAKQKKEYLLELVNSSPEHKAAMRRIIGAMPAHNRRLLECFCQ